MEKPFAYYNPGDHVPEDLGWWYYDPSKPDSDVGPFDTRHEAEEALRKTLRGEKP